MIIIVCYIDDNYYYIENGINGLGYPSNITDFKEVYTTSHVVAEYLYETKGILVNNLSYILGLSNESTYLTLFQIFDYFFKIDDTDVKDIDMIRTILESTLLITDYTYMFLLGNEVSWFTVRDNGIKYNGTMFLGTPISSYSIGKSIKYLRHAIAKSGCSVVNVCVLSWGYMFLKGYYKRNYDFQNICSDIDGLSPNLNDVYEKISNIINIRKKEVTSKDIVFALSENTKALGLKIRGDTLLYKKQYLKDYSICRCTDIPYRDCSYGIIMDCEGVTGGDGSLQAGCRQLGIILFAKYKENLVPLYSLTAEKEFISETLLSIPDLYRDVANSPIPKGGIPVYIYGVSDKVMITGHIEKAEKRVRKRLQNLFRFINVQHQVIKILDDTGMKSKRTLQNIARHFKVYAVRPKHNALSDARTLFNILSAIEKGDY